MSLLSLIVKRDQCSAVSQPESIGMKHSFLLLFTFMVFAEAVDIQKTLHDGNNQLTSRMFYEIANKNPHKSVVLSAFSVITPLSQFAIASEGPSHEELLNAVGFSNDTITNDAFALINVKYTSIEGVELKMANKFYIPLGYQVHDEFANISKNVFHSEIVNVDFSDNINTAKEINNWVEDQTNHRIKDLVDSSSITPDTRGVLVNALYFKGSWKYPFMDYATVSQNFYVNKQRTLEIPIMHNTEEYRYMESENLKSKILELPYKGDQSSFVIVLPNDVEGIEQLLEKLKDPNILDEETSKMSYVEVRVSIPKFKIETTTDLKEALMKINVTKIFGDEANLTKLLKSDEVLYVSNAIQKAFIEVNEEGAEAAAANSFIVGVAASLTFKRSVEFVADHPFAFFLNVHGEVFFNGVFYG